MSNNWTPIGNFDDIIGSPGFSDGTGRSVSLSADGTILAVGEPGVDGSAGRVRVFTRTLLGSGGWSAGVVVASGTPGSTDSTGMSVSLSGDGDTLAVGEPGIGYSTAMTGHQARVFTRPTGGWTNTMQGIAVALGLSISHKTGYSVSLSGDGSTLAVGEPGGASVRVFTRPAGVGWSANMAGNIIAHSVSVSDNTGFSVSLSGDGATLAVGENEFGNGTGRVRVFTRPAGGWTLVNTPMDGAIVAFGTPGFNDQTGYSVSLSGGSNGAVLAVGEPRFNGGVGRVRVFTRPVVNGGGEWSIGDTIASGTTSSSDATGSSVVLSRYGATLAVGEIGADGYAGRVRAFALPIPPSPPPSPPTPPSPPSPPSPSTQRRRAKLVWYSVVSWWIPIMATLLLIFAIYTILTGPDLILINHVSR